MRCLMPGARPSVKPLSAGESSGSSASDEVSQLELQSQRQLEEDVARIFDESIYSDLEVVCGKLKILTHSCILKARTHKFYQKLEAILHVNIGRSTFDEIYSFISDAYTECNIQQQEKEIIDYLNENLSLGKNVKNSPKNKPDDKDEPEIYSTPSCVSPEEKSFHKTQSPSPSTELTKEYYALVPIDGSVLDKELFEQDALSNAFQSISKSQFEDINAKQNTQCVKPTSLCLNSSHISKLNKHSNSCDILKKSDSHSDFTKEFEEKRTNGTSQTRQTTEQSEADKSSTVYSKTSNLPETSTDKVLEQTYTPDSLIADEPSSSSDYLSAAYAVSPGTVFSSGFSQLNVGENATKMDNIVTISDSGLETSGMLESLNSHKDVTLTDVSLTESTLHDMVNDDNGHDSASYALDKSHVQIIKHSTSLNSPTHSGTSTGKEINERKPKSSFTEMNATSTKEEKQRQNEEIVILESSSLSSETGSWESVFPPKLPEKDICERFIASERNNALKGETKRTPQNISNVQHEAHDDLCPSLVQKSPFKSTSCFIDAASLADEGDDVLTVQTDTKGPNIFKRTDMLEPSQPVPCALKRDLSPNDWSGSNDNEDSLEQADKDPDSIQKDLSPTIFEMTPITEDSLGWNACETTTTEQKDSKSIQDPIITENALMQSSAITAGFIGAVGQKDFEMKHDPVTVEKSFMQLCANTQGVPVASDQKELKATHDPIMANNGCASNSALRSAFSTPNNSIISVRNLDFKMYESESENDTSGGRHDSNSLNPHLDSDGYISDIPSTSVIDSSSTIPSITSVDNHSSLYGSQPNGSLTKREIENIPIVSGAYIPEPEEIPERPQRAPSNSSFWVVDMSSSPKSDISECSVKLSNKPVDKSIEELRSASKSTNSGESYKSRSSVDSDSSEKSTHKFYIDLSTLPDAVTPEQKQDKDEGNEKKNIFSMFIDLGDKSTTAKEMPARFSSSLNAKKVTKTEIKNGSKGSKTPKAGDPKIITSSVTTITHATDDSILFEKLESLCADPTISISEIINIPLNIEYPTDVSEVSNMKRKDNDLINKVIQEEPAAGEPHDLFVKLSDLDKPAPKAEPVTITVKRETHERMTRSIPDNDWRESSQTINLRSTEIISSFHSENALSLNRLFPHLKNDFSRSMPGSLSSRTRSPLRLGVTSSPGDIDEHQPFDVSEMSSIQSSYCRSVVENSTTEETEQTSSLISNCQSRLGQDLLRMFLEEIAPDVIVEVSGRRIKAHKCILSSRCQYFAGILSGGWVESAGNVISLPPFTFSVVHFALCHIYSGVSVIPDSISIVELATLADMLGLEGLKEGIMFMLKAKYCHHFHKPCTLCTAGVLECFPLASVYGLDDLYRKCLRWITKYFHRVWPTKAFATLPFELIEKCCQEHIVNLTTDNFVVTVFGCGMTVSSLVTSRWAGVVARMCRRLVNAAAQFAATRLYDVLRAMEEVPAEAPPAAVHALHDCLAASIEWAPPEQACRSYHLLTTMAKEARAHHYPRPDLIADGAQPAHARTRSLLSAHAGAWRVLCEGALVRNAPRVLPTAAFAELPTELRDRLRDLGCISYGAPAGWSPRAPRRPRASPAPAASRSLDIDQVRACFVPYAAKPQPHLGSIDSLGASDARAARLAKTLPPTVRSSKPREDRPASKMTKTFPPSVRTTKAQEERAKYNSTKTSQSIEKVAPRPIRTAYENTRPRYMEPRQPKEKPPVRKPQPKMVSSSDSSRNSSPVLRGARARASRDSLAPPAPRPRTADLSTDSLSESHNADKYATYTKAKHNTEGSVAVAAPGKAAAAAPASVRSHAAAAPSVRSYLKTTKIPVYLNKSPKVCNTVSVAAKEPQRRVPSDKSITNSLSPVPQRNKTNERRPFGSLMNATKSSQAKMVSKTIKETTNTKYVSKQDRNAEAKIVKSKNASSRSPTAEIPVMERSGTFLKDEPMFGDKTTNIDIDE